MLVSGTPRFIVRKTTSNIIVQVATYDDKGDNILVTVTSDSLRKLGWKHSTGNIPAAYFTGMLAAKKAMDKKIPNAIVDLGLQSSNVKGSRLYASVKGAIDAGMKIPCSEEALPSADRVSGKHIAAYSKISKQFKTPADNIEKSFEEMKLKIKK